MKKKTKDSDKASKTLYKPQAKKVVIPIPIKASDKRAPKIVPERGSAQIQQRSTIGQTSMQTKRMSTTAATFDMSSAKFSVPKMAMVKYIPPPKTPKKVRSESCSAKASSSDHEIPRAKKRQNDKSGTAIGVKLRPRETLKLRKSYVDEHGSESGDEKDKSSSYSGGSTSPRIFKEKSCTKKTFDNSRRNKFFLERLHKKVA